MLTAAVALFCCLLGLVFTTGAGEYWLTLFDTFGATGSDIVILQQCTLGESPYCCLDGAIYTDLYKYF